MKIYKYEELDYDKKTYQVFLKEKPFCGFSYFDSSLGYYENGFLVFAKNYDGKVLKNINFWYEGSVQTGYEFYFNKDSSDKLYLSKSLFWDFGVVIERFGINNRGQIVNYGDINDEENEISKREWLSYREDFSDPKMFDFLPFYKQQDELKQKRIFHDVLPKEIKYLAGVDIAYDELEQRLVAGVSILDALTFQIIEEVIYEEKVNYPYVPGFFSFREVKPVLEAFKKLIFQPDLTICYGHGISHFKGIGIATQLGIELNIPTIGCAQKSMVGYYDDLGHARFSITPLVFDNKEIGKVLQIQNNTEPIFVSVGHKISIETACEWISRLTLNEHLPKTILAVNTLTNRFIKERTDWDTPLEFYLEKMEKQTKNI